MNLTKFDILLLTTMSLSVILISLVFPALGLTDATDEQGESDVPEFNISEGTFDLAGDFPERGQNAPDRGTIVYEEDVQSADGRDIIWIERPKDTGTSIQVVNNSGTEEIWFRNWSSTGSVRAGDDYAITEEGEEIIHANDSWTIDFTVQTFDDPQQSNMTIEVQYDVRSRPNNSQGNFGFGSLEALANVLGFLGLIIRWMIVFIVELGINLLVILFNITSFIISLLHWLLSTYFSVVSAASNFAAVILMVPGILLFGVFAKLGMIFISLLPTT